MTAITELSVAPVESSSSSDTSRRIQRSLGDRTIPPSMLGLDNSDQNSPPSTGDASELRIASPYKGDTSASAPTDAAATSPEMPAANQNQLSFQPLETQTASQVMNQSSSSSESSLTFGQPADSNQKIAPTPVSMQAELGGTVEAQPSVTPGDALPAIAPGAATDAVLQEAVPAAAVANTASPSIDGVVSTPPTISSSAVESNQGLLPGTADSEQLPANGTVASPPVEDSSSGTLDASSAANASPASQPQWTYLVDLAESYGAEGGSPVDYQQLQNLANQTAGTNSQIIVQAVAPEGMLNTYTMQNGEMTLLPPTQSAGTAADLQNLVSMAPSTGQVALIIESHGNAEAGITGDYGDATVNQVESAIQNGLATSGQTELSTLDLNSCLMANAQTLTQLAPLASTIVASENLEYYNLQDPANNLQNTVGALSNLLADPPTDGTAVANQLINSSTPDTNNGQPGTLELASFDSSQASQFNSAFNNFASALNTAATSSVQNTSGVESAIGSTPDTSNGTQLRDIGTIAQNVIAGINTGSIQDPSGDLQSAAQGLLSAESNYVTLGYSQDPAQTGINVFAPDQAALNPNSQAASNVDKTTLMMGQLSGDISAKANQMAPDQQISGDDIKNFLPDLMQDPNTSSLLATPGGYDALSAFTGVEAVINQQGYASGEDLANLAAAAASATTELVANRSSLIAADANQQTGDLDDLYTAQLPDIDPDSGTSTPWSQLLTTLVTQEGNNDIPLSPPSASVWSNSDPVATVSSSLPDTLGTPPSDGTTTDSPPIAPIDGTTLEAPVITLVDGTTPDAPVTTVVDGTTTDTPVTTPVDSPTLDSPPTTPVDSPTLDSPPTTPVDSTTTDPSATAPVDSTPADPSATTPVDSTTTDPSATTPVDSTTTDPSATAPVDSTTTDPPATTPVDSTTTDPSAAPGASDASADSTGSGGGGGGGGDGGGGDGMLDYDADEAP